MTRSDPPTDVGRALPPRGAPPRGAPSRGPLERVLARTLTGTIAHLAAFVVDLATALAVGVVRTLRRRAAMSSRPADGQLPLTPAGGSRPQPEEANMPYADGFVIAVPKDRVDEYEKIARDAGAVWREYGALSVVECVADDVPYGELTSFPRAVQATDEETVIFSWIVYESREARDEINQKVMADERIKGEMSNMPFDGKRMIYGGFRTLVEL